METAHRLSKAQVLEIMDYCHRNNLSYAQRLRELGYKNWQFHDARQYLRKHGELPEDNSHPEFLEIDTGKYLPTSILNEKRRSVSVRTLDVEFQTPSGCVLRISGLTDLSQIIPLLR